MIPALRHAFNQSFTDAGYARYVQALTSQCGVPIEFRLSETPCFFPASLLDELASAARAMVEQLLSNAAYRRAADAIIPPQFRVANSEPEPTFVQVDFGLVRIGDRVEGRLVELQAFPSLYGFQLAMAETAHDVWGLGDVRLFPGSLTRERYMELMRGAIVAGHDPAEVVLMEIDPQKQKTLPDFAITEKSWGVRAIDIRQVKRQGRELFYDRDGRLTRIRRVYNRVIPDDLVRTGVQVPFDYRDDLDVEWTGGPDWFFRLSKFSLPWLDHPWVPKTMFLSDVEKAKPGIVFPEGVFSENDTRLGFLLKPLFSYAGGGLIFSPTEADIADIPERQRHLYVLQERIAFTPVIDTPYGPTQAEIRLMFVGRDFVLPLVRMGRGKMMGVDHNKGLSWVGASAGLIG
jgi:hypothetical protein